MDVLFARPSTFNVTVCSGWGILILLAIVLFDIRFIINLLRIQLWLAFDEEGFGGFC